MISDKIITAGVEEVIKDPGAKIGFTNGCFDILHAGHVKYLEEAKNLCDILFVGVNSDSSVRRLKGDERPVNGERARMEVVAALESVDFVLKFEEDTPIRLIEAIEPDVLFKGGDWKEDDIVGSDIVKAGGGKVVVIPFVEGFSTTGTIEKLKRKQS
ncbi:MAG: D-glycero-beta-D-manno-heptose 1-phosphate adenylyltransferase [Candidatus Omnitrophica bacterium]|nr:D-glycero-beta-D-manno-heptose 1-phosphate adenylyltransferase [Candidatus Omnitrophota bacterium]